MPKPKPDNIVRHEIVLGRSERELLDTMVTANAANKILTPLVAGMSDVTFVALVILAYNYLFDENIDIPADAGGLVYSLKQDFDLYRSTEEYQTNYRKRAGSFAGGIRNLFENIIGGFGKGPDDINL
jgi:hypothetical protein